MNYTVISRDLINAIKFRQFDETDYYGFAGVESPIPLIGELESEGILMIIDGGHAELYAFDGDGNMDCVDTCENINALPYKTENQKRIEREIAAMEKSLASLKAELAVLENDLCN